MNKLRKYFQFKRQRKGSSLLIAIFLSGLILTIGITASRLMLKEVTLSADAINSEKAYYSAESGVEEALLSLRNEPVDHVELASADPALNVDYDLSIINRIEPTPSGKIKDKFSFTLPKFSNQQFRLRYDSNSDLYDSTNGSGATIEQATNFKMIAETTSGSPSYQWKITCQDKNTGETKAIIKTETLATINDFTNHPGCLSTSSPSASTCTEQKLSNWVVVDKSTCFLSIQNLGNDDAKFTFSGGTLSGHEAKVIAIGKSNNREKQIVFDYAQKNIGSLFNFALFHTEIGL